MSQQKVQNKGKWRVHKQHGVGRIIGQQEMCISGEPQEYYKFKTKDRLVWIPVEDWHELENHRSVLKGDDFAEVLEILQRPFCKMRNNFKARQKRIREVRQQNSVKAIARLVRDLRGRQKERNGLGQLETRTLERLTRRLVAEWSASRGLEPEIARERLDDMLSQTVMLSPRPIQS